MRTTLEDNDGFGLYKTQQRTNGLFVAAVKTRRTELLDSLASLYLIPAAYLQQVTTYNYYYIPGGNGRLTELDLPEPTRLWISSDHTESILDSSQFLFLIANAIALIQNLPDRTIAMEKLVDTYWPVLIEHYERWIFAKQGPFQVRGWGCVSGNFNHREFVEKKLTRSLGDSHSYCNVVTDTDLWIIAGTAELLAAHEAAPNLLKLDPELHRDFLNYVRLGVTLIQSRTETTTLEDWEGRSVTGIVFDPGAWRDHPDYAFAGYSGELFPTEENRSVVEGVGWDFGHAARYVEVFEALYRRRDVLGTQFPDRSTMEGLANQLAYRIFNGNFEKPLFANFFDGTNGWFRVNYDDRKGFGYAPYDISSAIIYGSYGRWSEFNSDISKIMNAFWIMIYSDKSDVIQHRLEHYERRHYWNFERPRQNIFDTSNSVTLLPLLSSFPAVDDTPPALGRDILPKPESQTVLTP